MSQIIVGQWQPATKLCSLCVAALLPWGIATVPRGSKLAQGTCYLRYNNKTASEVKEMFATMPCAWGALFQIFVFEGCGAVWAHAWPRCALKCGCIQYPVAADRDPKEAGETLAFKPPNQTECPRPLSPSLELVMRNPGGNHIDLQ